MLALWRNAYFSIWPDSRNDQTAGNTAAIAVLRLLATAIPALSISASGLFCLA
jgi:hypothetical protein